MAGLRCALTLACQLFWDLPLWAHVTWLLHAHRGGRATWPRPWMLPPLPTMRGIPWEASTCGAPY